MIIRNKVAGVLLVAFSISMPVVAQTCKPDQVLMSGKPHQYIDNNDGTVTDIVAGLIWQKCSLGQEYKDGQCLSEPADYSTWSEALAASKVEYDKNEGFRLPNIKELGSIVERGCLSPAIDLAVFPSTPSSIYWSNTISITSNGALTESKGRVIDFISGVEFIADVNESKYIRLVKPML